MSDTDGRPDLDWFDQQMRAIGEVDVGKIPLAPQEIQDDPRAATTRTGKSGRQDLSVLVPPVPMSAVFVKNEDEDEDDWPPSCDIGAEITEHRLVRNLAKELRRVVMEMAGDFSDDITLMIEITTEDGCSYDL